MDRDETKCRWSLKPIQISRLDGSIEITDDGVSIGRSESNTVMIPESGFPYVSSSHCRIRMVDGVPVLEDLGSKNGTLVNGSRADNQPLANGDILQLGNMGPRFAVVCSDNLRDTVPTVALPATDLHRGKPDLTQSALVRIKRALGVPRDSNVGALIETRGRRGRRSVWVALGVVAIGAAGAIWAISQQTGVEASRLLALNEDLQQKLAKTLEGFDGQRRDWVTEKNRLEQERKTLTGRLAKLESDEETSATKLTELREQLSKTDVKLESYNPINLETRRLKEVARVTRAVVLIEVSIAMRHKASNRLLHDANTASGEPDFNLDDNGEVWTADSSGSGFCVTEDGWILTNAHVVRMDLELPAAGFEPEMSIQVVFTGQSKRHRARTVKAIYEGADDMALLKIEPYEGMPHVGGIDVDFPVPEGGTTVFLSGFPLGKMVIQPDKEVIASTFKGILSRVVRTYLQVDAAVHPGNSGGPVMDQMGHVIGLVTRVQRTPDDSYAPTIGYIIPVKALSRIWPPE